jgi:hypothetical protein
MRTGAHLRLAILAVILWAAFFVGGLPHYDQQYGFAVQAGGSALLVPIIGLAGGRVIVQARAERRRTLALWLSFYATVPFLILDVCYCGVYLGLGAGFLRSHWYLTIFYVIPWLLFVPVGLRSAR